jgi:hypothetical protein
MNQRRYAEAEHRPLPIAKRRVMSGLELSVLMQYPDKTVVILSILVSSGIYAFAAQQAASAPQPTSGIFGRVVSAETHKAVRRAIIKVYTSRDQWDEFTDSEGRFRFPALAPGEYTLIVHRDGYTNRAYNVERSDFDEQKELPIQLHPQAVITGKVVDGLGQALQSAQIQALATRTSGGKIPVLTSADTNDLGEYRLSGLDPGTYRVRATFSEGRASELDPTPLTMATSYYGGSEKAAEVAVKAGSVTTGIDFVLNPVRPVTVRGTLHTETGVLAEPATLWITGLAGEGGHNDTGKDGKFEISDVGPGTYTISAETLNKSAPLFGISTVEVHGADVDAIDILLKPIPKIDGELRVERGGSADLKLGSIYFTRTDLVTAMPMQIGHPDNDRRFTVSLIPGEYNLSFDDSISKLGVQWVTLDDKPITNWKLHIDGSSETKKLVVALGSKPQQ